MNHHMKILVLFLATLTVAQSQPQLHEGDIDGAKFIILAAEKPSGKVLLLAHGYRGKDNPLSADFDQKGALTQSLLAEGWTIASTSYRRNGWIIDDALADLRALQEKVVSIQGKPTTTLIIGNSMGGQIAILAAEGALKIDGAITTGAALQNFPKKGITPKLSFKPKVPVILLINQEANRPMSEHYFKKAGNSHCALWKIERPGHCNVADVEKLAAIKSLQDWNDGKAVPREKDATTPIPNNPSTATTALIGKASHVGKAWGNITTTYVSSDLKTLGAKLKDRLRVTVGTKSETFILARHYSEVPIGKGVAFITPEGYLSIQIFGKSLAKKLGAKEGDQLILSIVRLKP